MTAAPLPGWVPWVVYIAVMAVLAAICIWTEARHEHAADQAETRRHTDSALTTTNRSHGTGHKR